MNTREELPSGRNETLVDRAKRLFLFLHDLAQLRTKSITNISQYDKILWFADIPSEKGCASVFDTHRGEIHDNDIWLEVKKPLASPPPEAPAKLKRWLDPACINDITQHTPGLLQEIEQPDKSGNTVGQPGKLYLKDIRSEIIPLWEKYVETQWWPWKSQQSHQKAVHKFFADLYSIYQRQEKLGESYEVVLGLGCLQWKTSEGDVIKRHLITTQTNLSLDVQNQCVIVKPASSGVQFKLEEDMLPSGFTIQPEIHKKISDTLQKESNQLLNRKAINGILEEWLKAFDADGHYDPAIHHDPEISETPKIVFSPAIILRRRTEQILQKTYAEIVNQINITNEIPDGVASLIAVQSTETANSSVQQPDTFATKELYFPLPANEEQRGIITRFEQQQGVVVQGPPGTGKSHTIANLISHLLATGNRVLVTSHTARALKVLEKMLPREIADLCVVALGDDEKALEMLEKSVVSITQQQHRWNAEQNSARIKRLEAKLEKSRQNDADIIKELQDIRQKEIKKFAPGIGDYKGTLQNIAARLLREAGRYQWFQDTPPVDAEPLLTNTDAIEYLHLIRQITPNQETILRLNLVAPTEMLTVQQFAELADEESIARDRFESMTVDIKLMGQHQFHAELRDIPSEAQKELYDVLSKLIDTYDLLDYHAYPWVRKATRDALEGRYSTWEILLKKTGEHTRFIEKHIKNVAETEVSGINSRDLRTIREDALKLLAHFSNNGGLGFGPFRPKVIKDSHYLLKNVTVDGHPCNTAGMLERLIEYIDIADRFSMLTNLWSKYAETPKGVPFELQIAEYNNFLEPLRRINELNQYMLDLQAATALYPMLRDPQGVRINELRDLRTFIHAMNVEKNYQKAQSPFIKMEGILQKKIQENNIHPLMKELLAYIKERDCEGYESALQALQSVWNLRTRIEKRNKITRELQEKLPRLTQKLFADVHATHWDERMAHFEEAWNHARIDQWVNAQNNPEQTKILKSNLALNQLRINEITAQLAAAKAWQHCFTRMTESERQSLEAWHATMRRVGKGTGKLAQRDRQKAREHLEGCRGAIPAWVMPIYRIAETLHPGKEQFDVVIIDEASQSGPEALFLSYLAKKIVVVGDDKQISPEFIGVKREDVEHLRNKYLFDLPHSDVIGVENSFFDQALIRYGNSIRLREHFRCMPEIIEYSNRLSYQGEPLMPLRQYGSSRLMPVIVRRFIRDAEAVSAGGGIVNKKEAEALARQVQKCCKDPAYDNKSMGVISLQGNAQARLIEKILLRTIGAEEIEKRNIVCGDSYAFQGDERDVIFLSMVSAPNRRIGVLSGERDMRRFNVGFSRARDQIFLFHSAQLEDLSPRCLRYHLLEYCKNPGTAAYETEIPEIDDLQEAAEASGRNRLDPPLPFETWLEVDVYLQLIEKGYHVTPQFEIDRYRIDLVVEGTQGKLAVECLGDEWNGPEEFAKNIVRQQRLEQCGWQFIQLYGSEFYRNPVKAMGRIYAALAASLPVNGVYTNGALKTTKDIKIVNGF